MAASDQSHHRHLRRTFCQFDLAEVDTGVRGGVTTAETQRVKDLEREIKELRRANEILKLNS